MAKVGQVGRVRLVGWVGQVGLVGLFTALSLMTPTAQRNPNAPANFVKVQGPVVALTHARVIDGTGAAAREDQTIVIRDGNIASVSAAAPPDGAPIVDLTGKSVIPGLVLEHGFYAATDFVTDKQPDVCPGQARGQQTVAALDENGAPDTPFGALVKKLVDAPSR